MKANLVALLIILTFLLCNCIQTPEPDTPKRINFLFNVDNVGNTIIIGQDSIEVDEIKFLSDKINLTINDGVILQTGIDALVMTYRSAFGGNDETILSASIGYEDVNQFQGMELFIDQPQESDNIQDNDFFGDDVAYSFIVKGTYNGQVFTYTSGVSFSKTFDFPETIELSNTNETLILRTSMDIREVFVDPSTNVILSPTNPDNKPLIDSHFKESLDVKPFSADLF